MTASKHDERIQKLQQQLEQAKALKRKAEARARAAESKKARAQDTRRKVLLGAMMQDWMNREPQAKQALMARLDQYLTRTDDRALFGLPPATTEPAFLGDDYQGEPPTHVCT